MQQLFNRAAQHLQERYGCPARWIVAAPGRVNLIGEHVDYNDGLVLPMAIERYCVIAAGECDEAQRPNHECRMTNVGQDPHSSFVIHHLSYDTGPSSHAATVFSSAAGEEAVVPLAAPQRHPAPGHWSNYVAGVVAGCRERSLQPGPFQAVIESNVPYGGGLSSSAALEVATATLIEAATGHMLGDVDKALLCQRAEHEFAGVPCGIMDQFASVMCRADHLMLLDCRSREIKHVPFQDPRVTMLIVDSNVKHALVGGAYGERRRQCESAARRLGVPSLRDVSLVQLAAKQPLLDPTEFRRARHVVGEIERTLEAAAAVEAGDWRHVGRLMYASHDSLRDDYEVSCRELDVLVESARQLGPAAGLIGARMTGGGFGGCTVNLVETAQATAAADALARCYRAATGIEPNVIMSRPARGAHVLRRDQRP